MYSQWYLISVMRMCILYAIYQTLIFIDSVELFMCLLVLLYMSFLYCPPTSLPE